MGTNYYTASNLEKLFKKYAVNSLNFKINLTY